MAYDWIHRYCLLIKDVLMNLCLLDTNFHDYQCDLQGHSCSMSHLNETYYYSNHSHEHYLQDSALREPYEFVENYCLAGVKKASVLDLHLSERGWLVMESDW